MAKTGKRTRGRPKGSTKKNLQYNAYQRRIINQRLYKLERNNLYKDSNKYMQTLKNVKNYGRYDDETGKLQTLAWELALDEYGDEVLRMRSYTKEEWDKLSQVEKEKYLSEQEHAINASTTMKTGIMEKFKKAYATFMDNHDMPGLTLDQYIEMWRTARDMVDEDLKWDKIYSAMTQLIENHDISYLMNEDQFNKALEYGANDKFFNIDNKFLKSTITNYTPKYSGGTTTVTKL